MDVYDDPLFGKSVKIDHGDGIICIYSNLGDELAEGIAKGVSVGEGQIIGAIGDTSIIECAESDHLHFELLVEGKHENPADFFEFSDSESDL